LRQQHFDAGLTRCLNRGTPEHRLPDPGVAANDDSARVIGEVADELSQPGAFVLPRDELEPARNHHPVIVADPTRSF